MDKESFSRNLQTIRSKKNISVETFCNQLNIQPIILETWEDGLVMPKSDMIVKIAKVLGVKPNELVKEYDLILENDKIQLENEQNNTDEEDNKWHDKNSKYYKRHSMIATTSFLACLGCYLIVGFYFMPKTTGWSHGSIIMAVPVIISSITEAILKKSWNSIIHSTLPMSAIFIYLFCGLFFNQWTYSAFVYLAAAIICLVLGIVSRKKKSN